MNTLNRTAAKWLVWCSLLSAGCSPMTSGTDAGSAGGAAVGGGSVSAGGSATGGGGTATGGGTAGGTAMAGGTAGGTAMAGGTAGGTTMAGGTAGGTAMAGGAAGGSVVDAGTPMPLALTQLSAGETSTCAVLSNKTVRCWGRNNEGQLGDGTTMERMTPVSVMGLTTAASVSVGYEHTCAVLDDGTVRCWGLNGSGQLGNNSTTRSPVPVPVMGLTGVASIHAGVYSTCARLTGGTVSCWGRGGELGSTSVTGSLIPVAVPGLSNVSQLSIAPNSGTSSPLHVCGVRTDGTAFCWGNNSDGQLGDGTQNPSRVPVNVMGVTDALEITAGGSHACARRTSGLFCWGFSQEVGDGTVERRLVPTAVMTTTMVTSLEAGNGFTLARTAAGGLICWGRNGRGQCGDSAAFTPSGPIYLAPINSTLANVSLFVSGGSHACAYVPSTMVTWCWGDNLFRQLGYELPAFVSRTSVPDFVRW